MARLLDMVDEDRFLRLAATQPESTPQLAGYLSTLGRASGSGTQPTAEIPTRQASWTSSPPTWRSRG
jgi:hypothetical protein